MSKDKAIFIEKQANKNMDKHYQIHTDLKYKLVKYFASIEEMADVLEVLQAICIARGYTLKQLEEVRRKKAAERGGFKKRIYWEGNQV